jgi:hypothetical protein
MKIMRKVQVDERTNFSWNVKNVKSGAKLQFRTLKNLMRKIPQIPFLK